jgi:hypothetical protein
LTQVLTRQFITDNSFLAGMQMSHTGVLKSIARPYLTFGEEFGEKKPSGLDNRACKKNSLKEGLTVTLPGTATRAGVRHTACPKGVLQGR